MSKRYTTWAVLFTLLSLGFLASVQTQRAMGEGLHDVVHVVPFYLEDSTATALTDADNGTVKAYRSQGDTTGTTIWLDYSGTAGLWHGRDMTYSELYALWFENDDHDYTLLDSLYVAAPQLGDSVITRSANFAAEVIPEDALRDSILANAHFDPDTTYNIALGTGATVPDAAIAASIMRTSQVSTYMDGGTLDAVFDSLYVASHCSTEVAYAESIYAADLIVPDDAYAVGWNGDFNVPTKNAVYDKIQTISTTTVDNSLASTYIIVGNAGGVATDMQMSQDVTLDNTAKATIQDAAVEVSDLNDASDAIAAGELLYAYGAETFGGLHFAAGTLTLNQECQDTTFYVAGVTTNHKAFCSWKGQPQWSSLTLDMGYTLGIEVKVADSLRVYTEPSSNPGHDFQLDPSYVNYWAFGPKAP